jgi:hypothetical protein
VQARRSMDKDVPQGRFATLIRSGARRRNGSTQQIANMYDVSPLGDRIYSANEISTRERLTVKLGQNRRPYQFYGDKPTTVQSWSIVNSSLHI